MIQYVVSSFPTSQTKRSQQCYDLNSSPLLTLSVTLLTSDVRFITVAFGNCRFGNDDIFESVSLFIDEENNKSEENDTSNSSYTDNYSIDMLPVRTCN